MVCVPWGIIFLVFGCITGIVTQRPIDDDWEPNNSKDQIGDSAGLSVSIGQDNVIETLIFSNAQPNEEDWYKFQLDGTQNHDVTVSIKFPPASGSIFLDLLADDGTFLIQSFGIAGHQEGSVILSGNQLYYIRLTSPSTSGHIIYNISILVDQNNVMCSGDGFNNHDFATAAPLDFTNGNAPSFNICTSADDYFTISAISNFNDVNLVAISGGETAIAILIYVESGGKQALVLPPGEAAPSYNNPTFRRLTLAPSTTYYVRIKCQSGISTPYQLFYQPVTCPSTRYSTLDSAPRINDTLPHVGTACAGDPWREYFQFQGTAGQTVQIMIHFAFADLDFVVLKKSNEEIIWESDSSDPTLEWAVLTLPDNGTYYIQVKAFTPIWLRYTILLTYSPLPCPATRNTSMFIDLDSQVNLGGTICPRSSQAIYWNYTTSDLYDLVLAIDTSLGNLLVAALDTIDGEASLVQLDANQHLYNASRFPGINLQLQNGGSLNYTIAFQTISCHTSAVATPLTGPVTVGEHDHLFLCSNQLSKFTIDRDMSSHAWMTVDLYFLSYAALELSGYSQAGSQVDVSNTPGSPWQSIYFVPSDGASVSVTVTNNQDTNYGAWFSLRVSGRPTAPPRNPPSAGLNTVQIIGLVVGLVSAAVLAAMITILVFQRRRYARKLREQREKEGVLLQRMSSMMVIHPDSVPPPNLERAVEIDYREISDMEIIGKGSFGIVCSAMWRETVIAVKQMHSNLTDDEKSLRDFQREADLLSKLRPHPHVVLFLGITVPPQPLTIITEYCGGGSLYSLFTTEISLSRKKSILLGIARGMLHLHREFIIHRDLACRNVLLSENHEPKVSDFGLSRIDTDENKTVSEVGPLKWMSPEAISEKKYSTKSDVWSFGVVIFELVTQAAPFPDMDGVEAAMAVCYKGLTLLPPKDCDPTLATLMQQCFKKDPGERPTFNDICHTLSATKSALTISMSASDTDYGKTPAARRESVSRKSRPLSRFIFGDKDKDKDKQDYNNAQPEEPKPDDIYNVAMTIQPDQ
eukprot:TRINITY_DN15204_c0_g1_i1.p1 TRINITY_DN15204_c0_g1~~TRINITY_DN15204_c0_g1_i1.p1  ORF type:complete len:1031 (-),score=194.78 TRINITY_DN15204_c0_g1_i1:231-3323(-)